MTLSAVIRSSVTQAGGGARSTAAFYHPLIRCHASCIKEGSTPTSASTSAPASSSRRLLSVVKLALIDRPSLLVIFWPFSGSRRAETLSSTSIHVAANIHSFLWDSCACAFGTALHRAAQIWSSFVGSVGSWRGSLGIPEYICLDLGRKTYCSQRQSQRKVIRSLLCWIVLRQVFMEENYLSK